MKRVQWSVLLAMTLSASTLGEAMDCVMNPRSTIELGSHQDGILEALLVSRGDQVTKGQPLARLDSEMEAMTAELARIRAESDITVRSAQAQAKFRGREKERLESLRVQQSISASAFEEGEIEAELAQLSVETARMELELAKTEYARARAMLERRTIKSPVDGVIIDVVMSPGEYVYEQSTLMSIAEINPLHVEVYIPVSAYGSVEEGMSAIVRPEEPIGGEHAATVVVVDNVFDAASRTFGVRLALPNDDLELPAGARCTVEFRGIGQVQASQGVDDAAD
jgi:RND family efflux transporter MFP subunit